MFGLSVWHLAILLVVGLFVFGPERLPTMLRDLGKALRQVRQAANAMQEDLKAELGPEVGDLDLRSLHPRTFVEKHLFGDEEDPLGLDFLRKDDLLGDRQASKDAGAPVTFDKQNGSHQNGSHQNGRGGKLSLEKAPEPEPAGEIRYDVDAT
jgi:sec-independent protein translocase protein TatB